MASSSSNQNITKKYSRGPYAKNLYKTTTSVKETDPAITKSLLRELGEFRSKIRIEYPICDHRSKILGNLQGLIDCLTKTIKRTEEDPIKDLLTQIYQDQQKFQQEIRTRLNNLEEKADLSYTEELNYSMNKAIKDLNEIQKSSISLDLFGQIQVIKNNLKEQQKKRVIFELRKLGNFLQQELKLTNFWATKDNIYSDNLPSCQEKLSLIKEILEKIKEL